MIYKFYDTCSLLLNYKHLFEEDNVRVVISSITLQELEEIKTSFKKDAEIKFAARKLLHVLEDNKYKYTLHIYKPAMMVRLLEKHVFEETNDMKILACAYDFDIYEHPDETVFVTNDLALQAIANLYFGEDSITSVKLGQVEQYSGYKEVEMNDDQSLAYFYENINNNHFNLLVNQYLIIKDCGGRLVDRLCWTGETHRRLNFNDFKSTYFGNVKPLKGDIYQQFAADSLVNNDITMLCGKAGSGKTYLALGYLFSQLEAHNIDRIIIFCNPVVAKDAARLGFYPGTKFEKLMESQVGGILSSKIGDQVEVERLVQAGKLVLIPAGDARGYEVPANSGVYIMESQNLTVDLLRMLLQRISDNCKVIVDGDYTEQVDMEVYAGDNNGMVRMSQVFRGNDLFGQVELQNIHRSAIAALAEEMK